jgi:hypothetical protein
LGAAAAYRAASVPPSECPIRYGLEPSASAETCATRELGGTCKLRNVDPFAYLTDVPESVLVSEHATAIARFGRRPSDRIMLMTTRKSIKGWSLTN